MRRTALVVFCVVACASAATAADRAPAVGRILFWSDRDRPALWSMRPDGSGRRLLYRTVQNAKRPVLSGHRQVFVMNADGSHQLNLSRDEFDDEATSWFGSGLRA